MFAPASLRRSKTASIVHLVHCDNLAEIRGTIPMKRERHSRQHPVVEGQCSVPGVPDSTLATTLP